MQEEYLSELLLRSLKPKPRPRPPRSDVVFEWGLAGVEESFLQIYTVRASGVARWTLDGAWDKHAPVSFVEAVGTDAPIAIHQQIPGLLALECARVDVEAGPRRRYRPPPRPNPGEFLVRGSAEVCLAELLQWMGAPSGLRIYEQLPGAQGNREVGAAELAAPIKAPHHRTYRVQATAHDEPPWVWMRWMLAVTTAGHYVAFTRGTAGDDAWSVVRRIPEKLGECTVDSGTLRCSGPEWLARL